MIKLGVNIDHVATLRQARYRADLDSPNVEPNILEAAIAAEQGGADSITVHLRADRRHIQDRDVTLLRQRSHLRLNLEMGNTPEIVDFALALKPNDVCLVPENRAEVTTEGGLDAAGSYESLIPTLKRLQEEGIRVSLFIDPDIRQIDAARDLKAEMVELHTGAFANASDRLAEVELQRLVEAAQTASAGGLQVNAGHGINYRNISRILKIPNLTELNIGHSIVSRAVFVGLERAVREMRAAMNP